MLDATNRLSDALLTAIDRLVHPQWGVINRLVAEHDSLTGLHLVHAGLASPAYFRENVPSGAQTVETGTGAAFDIEQAHWSALGEAVERYCGSIFQYEGCRHAAGCDVDDAIDLAGLIRGGHPAIQVYDPHARRRWVKGLRLRDGAEVSIPAQMVFLGYEPDSPVEIICQNDSTGLACGSSFEGACLTALCETIERDAFASAWLLRRTAPRILRRPDDLNQFGPAAARALAEDARADVRLFHLAEIHSVHVVASCLFAPDGTGLMAAAAAPSLVRAIEKALTEVLQGRVAANRLMRRPGLASASDIRSTSDHALYYLEAERFAVVAAFCGSSEGVTIPDLEGVGRPATLGDIVSSAAKAGLEAYVVDLTTLDVRDLGLHVVRVVVPGLQPLIFGSACVDVPDQRRLDSWRALWGLHEGPLNPHPHPFP